MFEERDLLLLGLLAEGGEGLGGVGILGTFGMAQESKS